MTNDVDQDVIPEVVDQGLILGAVDQGLILGAVDQGPILEAVGSAVVLRRRAVVVHGLVTTVTVIRLMGMSNGVHIAIIMGPALVVLETMSL